MNNKLPIVTDDDLQVVPGFQLHWTNLVLFILLLLLLVIGPFL